MKNTKQFITSPNYDLGNGEIGRFICTLLLSKVIPLGNLGGGARVRGLLVLLLSHRLGGIIFPLLVPFEDKLHQLYQRFK